MTQFSSFWLVSLTPGVIISQLFCIDDKMNGQSEKRIARPADGRKSLRWPSLPDEVLFSKTPKWLKSLSFHHQQRKSPVSNSTFVLPKLPGSDHNFHQPEEESSDVHSQVHLPPLCTFSSGATGMSSDDKAKSSWLLPTFPAFHRKEVYHRQAAAREHQRRQLSAKVGRLPPISTGSSSSSPPLTVQSSSAPPPRSPRGVEGTSVTLLSTRSSRVGMRIEGDEGEEEEEVEEQVSKMPSTFTSTDVAGHRNEHVHLWSVRGSSRTRKEEEEEDDDERREKEELMALLRPVQVLSISGHHAPARPTPPNVDDVESYQPTATAVTRTTTTPTSTSGQSRDLMPSTPVNTTTADEFQWTIEWTPSADVFRHHSSPSPSNSSASDADELIGDEEMAAPWPVERHWRNGNSQSAASRVRHSPPQTAVITSSSTLTSRNDVEQFPVASTSPPVPALRAKTAHPSMSIDDSTNQLIDSHHYHHRQQQQQKQQPDREDSEEIIEEIEHVFDDIDIQSFDDESPDVQDNRIKEDDDLLDDEKSLFGGVQLEQLKKLLNNSGGNNNEANEVEEEEEADGDSGKETTSSSPTFRQHPSIAEQLLNVPHCLPNAIQQHQYYHPDDRPISRSPRVVHSPVLGQQESGRRVFVFEEEEVPDEFEDPAEASAKLANPPIIQVKSRSLASFASRNTPSPDENGRRQRSLPIRTTEKSVAPIKREKKIGVMPSSIINRQIKAGQSLSPATNKANRPESPQDPRTVLQTALKNIHSSEWEVKMEGIRRLEDLITSHSDSVIPELHIVVLALLEEVKNLRSQVSRAAIQSMGKMFQHCGKQMEQDLDRTVPLLLSKVGDTNRFIRDDAHAALINVTEYVSPPKAIVVIVGESLTHKNATVRAEAAKLLAAIVVKLGPAKSLSGAKDVTEKILPAAAHFIQDGSLDARAQAKKIFSVLIEDPVFDKAMQKYLSPSTIRNIQRTLDTLRKTNR